MGSFYLTDIKLLMLKEVSAELKDETTILFGDKISYLNRLWAYFHDELFEVIARKMLFILKTQEINGLSGHLLHSYVLRATFEYKDRSPYCLHTW